MRVLPEECGNLKSGITRSHLRLHPVRVVGNEGFRHYPKKNNTQKKRTSPQTKKRARKDLAIMVERVGKEREEEREGEKEEEEEDGGLGVG